MKPTSIFSNSRLFQILLVAGSLMLFRADLFGGDHGEGEWNDHSDDCHIDGSENMEATVILTATTNAPAGASGIVEIESENEDGTNIATLEIKTTGLDPGDYFLSVQRQSDGSTVDLGVITVNSCDEDDDDGDCDGHDEDKSSSSSATVVTSAGSTTLSGEVTYLRHDDGDDNDDQGDDSDCNGDLESESEVELPADLNPADISRIVLADASGNEILVGDVVTNGTVTFTACVEVSFGDGATNCTGVAQIKCVGKKGKWKNRFTMVTSGMPSSSAFDVHVNGEPVTAAKSNRKGKALVKKLPVNLLKVRSVSLVDDQGRTAAHAKF